MKVGIVGCGFVFDLYMQTIARHPKIVIGGVADRNFDRAQRVGVHYGLRVYDNVDALLSDPEIDIVANFTSIESHYEVSCAALNAGKHVYSEKPLTMTMSDARKLVTLSEEKNLRLSSAPSNALSPSVQTLWKAVEDGAVGDVRLVYAEFDDNPVYLLNPETWVSSSGAPWPYLHEYEMGCTWEHVGYHLTWMCAIFGPVRSVTAFSKITVPDKTVDPNAGSSTPDFSVACLDFASGVVGRITCSIAAPTDHRMRVIGNRGVVMTDTYRDYLAPVYLESFTPLALKSRNLRMVRASSLLQRLTGVGGRRLPLAESPAPGGGTNRSSGHFLRRLKASQRGVQDKAIGLAELADAISEERPHFPAPEFTLHVLELTLLIQAAGANGSSQELSTSFEPLHLFERTRKAGPDYKTYRRPRLLPRLLGATIIE